jgi:hypothetical protein
MSAPRIGKKKRTPEARAKRNQRRRERKKRAAAIKPDLPLLPPTISYTSYLDKIRKEYGDG